jgi:hypothetical protein
MLDILKPIVAVCAIFDIILGLSDRLTIQVDRLGFDDPDISFVLQ